MIASMKIRRGLRGPAVDPNQPPRIGELYWSADVQLIEAEANDPISQWGGEYGQISDPSLQETLANQATYNPDMDGTGTPSLIFDGGQWYILPDALKLRAQEQPLTIYGVVNRATTGAAAYISWAGDEANDREFYLFQTTSDRAGIAFGSTEISSVGDLPNGRHIITGRNDTDRQKLYVGRDEIVDVSTGSGGLDKNAEAMIGDRAEANFRLTGQLQAFHVYLGAHDEGARAEVWDWLEPRWNL